ncbi:MAG: chemotaxis protein CheW [Acidobacteriota bacterium]|nr:chemotaxis protein CheW [Acidobacteriota bacterium]
MVDLAKIRKKAKGQTQPENRQPTTDNATAKLEAFLATVGQKRAGLVQEVVAAPEDEVELLTFTLGDERYAIEIDDIAEIIGAQASTRIPNVDAGIVGVISVRGAIVTLVDVRSRLKQPPRDPSKDSRIIVVRQGAGLIGFEVDRVLRPRKIERAAIEPQPVVHADEESECIRGVIRGPNALTIVLDLSKLVA